MTSIWHVIEKLSSSSDFYHRYFEDKPTYYGICYFRSLVDQQRLSEGCIKNLNQLECADEDTALLAISLEEAYICEDTNEIENKILRGSAFIYFDKQASRGILVPVKKMEGRSVGQAQIESSVIGPKESFVEDLQTNINLIRKRLPDSRLIMKEITVGALTKTKVAVLYLEDITNPEYVQTVIQRLEAIQFDFIPDASFLGQMLDDNSNSIFPQVLDTERPDRLMGEMCYGSIGILIDGSPNALLGPVSLNRFFAAFEDYSLPWHIGSFFRILRIIAILFSIVATPLYVAFTTHHYAAIPTDLLTTLIASRSHVPFPPVLEALFLELIIELLREASARMPGKVGQTISIVGGIVIGTASVEASLTSNVLLIIVALSALASFTAPLYRMSSTIRVLRYPLLFFAQLGGLVGITLFIFLLTVHLLKLSSLGTPYLSPYYPLRVGDWNDAFIRKPYDHFTDRQSFYRAKGTLSSAYKKIKKKLFSKLNMTE